MKIIAIVCALSISTQLVWAVQYEAGDGFLASSKPVLSELKAELDDTARRCGALIGVESRTAAGQAANASHPGPFSPVYLIHIPRTGGTTLEELTRKMDPELRWGSLNAHIKNPNAPGGGLVSLERNKNCYGQHAPPSQVSFYHGKETFCVVRNPYRRIISEIGWTGKDSCTNKGCTKCQTQQMNDLLMERFHTIQTGDPYVADCHFLPQAAFVRGWDTEKKQVDMDQHSCTHVLHFENMTAQFNELMEEKGYEVRLNQKTHCGGTKSNPFCSKLETSDFNPEVLKFINEVYEDDFKLFGYEMLQPN